MKKIIPKVLALDLEGTLISNAMSQIPRPGLFEFLERCAVLFPRLVMFTTVNEDKFRHIARLLVEEGKAPAWFAHIEYVNLQGDTKNLEFIPDAIVEESILVDDFEIYVHPGQAAQWMQIEFFDYPYSEEDQGLFNMLAKLEAVFKNPGSK
ncbi:NIF family HAD-type phosphatase [Undibacterium pigrum]|uniref:NLI interacting factor-like phosphatase n=1 Tax=Undibacterium pigrum TaxID=401470 RepID=A0A318JA77_9BURK|nr:NIF family HAD-type phosphatase [Undibacterium pigrum]PXX44209.1 NLI interacting factor-like phosphatase [Undibacterium pigrum]